jgi:hypothetical protein
VGNLGEINDEFKRIIISNTALLAGRTKDAANKGCGEQRMRRTKDAANMNPANWTDVGKSDATRLTRKKLKVALGCMAVRAQNELL